jgi:hypothetical protein
MPDRTGTSIPLWLEGPSCPHGHPVKIGVPFPRGVLDSKEAVWLVDSEGRFVPLQTEVLAYWPDKSIQWLLLDFWAYKNGLERQTWHLHVGRTPFPNQTCSVSGPPNRLPEVARSTTGLLEPRGETPLVEQFSLAESVAGYKPASEQFAHAPLSGQQTMVPTPGAAIRVSQFGSSLWVHTGAVQFSLDQGRLGPIRLLRPSAVGAASTETESQAKGLCGTASLAELQTRLQLARGRSREIVTDDWQVECGGAVRLTLRADGQVRGCQGLRVRARLSFFAGTGLVCYRLTVHNSRRARHRGGLWDLGDPGSVLVRDLSVLLRWDKPIRRASVKVQSDGGLADISPHLQRGIWQLHQNSSGGPNWQSRNHLNRRGRVPCRVPGYEIRVLPTHSSKASFTERIFRRESSHSAAMMLEQGRRASPTAAVKTDEFSAAVTVPEFWQQFPKTLEITANYLRVGLWPQEWDDLHELQGGERKTHTVWFNFECITPGDNQEPSRRLDDLFGPVNQLAWVHEPILVVLPPSVWAEAGVLPHFIPAGTDSARRLDKIVTEAVTGPDSLLQRREIPDEYGWRNYGDLYADHENAHYPGPEPVVSHYNNQFDVIYGAILQEARTGNPLWRTVYDPLARHVMDIDLYHTEEDRPAYNGGLFWPTDHYLSAQTATHRTYSRANLPPNGKPYGGGPSPEHNYATGLLYYYWLTGERDALEAVCQLADWVLAMDDGSQTPWAIFDTGPTGLASATRSPDYHGPGRGAGNSIQTCLDAWLATGQQRYLEKAEDLIRRTVHPADRVEERQLLNAEERWSYTMYLVALARYLDLKIRHEQLDDMYHYAQAALVHYAAWMAEHEQPYLDRAEQLEYVTEAWPAQELRKANVLRLAARHAPEPLRSRLLQRATELADRAWSDWSAFPTRMSTRALAVLLVEGVRDAYYRQYREPPAPRLAEPMHFGSPQPFLPQRERVRRLLRQPGGWLRILGALIRPTNWLRLMRHLWRHRN